MATPIKEGLSSDYLEFSTALRPKFKPKSVIVYVESEEDIAFWRNILHTYETPTLRFEIKLPSNNSLAKGKTKALARSNDIFDNVTGKVGKFLLICVDSDYDYLLCEHYETEAKRTIAKKIQENDYIFQTYTYSIENLKCYAENLHTVCVAATFNDTHKIDFVAFMKVYSTIIYELFLWNLLFYSKGQDDNFTLTSFCSEVKILEVPNVADLAMNLEKIKAKIQAKITLLETNFPTQKAEVLLLGNKLKKLGLEKENACLFLQGHTIFDNVVLMLLKSVCKALKHEKEESIKSLAKHDKEKIEKLNQYQNQVGKLDEEVSKILDLFYIDNQLLTFSKIS
jgi:hypothetical protein